MKVLIKKISCILILGVLLMMVVGCSSEKDDVSSKVNYNLSKMTQTVGIDQGEDKISRIKARDEYKEIISLDQKAFDTMIKEFSETNTDKLREYIMAVACSEILKEKTMENDSGREWYNNYIENNK